MHVRTLLYVYNSLFDATTNESEGKIQQVALLFINGDGNKIKKSSSKKKKEKNGKEKKRRKRGKITAIVRY